MFFLFAANLDDGLKVGKSEERRGHLLNGHCGYLSVVGHAEG